jgi:uncharacterized protein YyaL (SSP411 family)
MRQGAEFAPASMTKPQFGVVIALLSAFFALGIFRDLFERYIPPLPPNKLANHPGGFLRAAVHEPIDWQPIYYQGLNEARQLEKPCLLVLGRPSSNVGRLMDLRVFSSWSVAAQVNATFVPIRIDLSDQPNWSPAVFPVSRMKIPFVAGFQILVLDSNGNFKKYLSPPEDLSQVDPTQFLDELVAIKQDFDNRGFEATSADANTQEGDVGELSAAATASTPPFNHYADALGASTSREYGAFVEGGYLRMRPSAWLYLARVGRIDEARRSLFTFLCSPATDILRGGFFNVNESSDKLRIDFSQEAVPNAEMAATLAELAVIRHEKVFNKFARYTFDMLVRDLRPDRRLFVTARPSDLDLSTNRSPKSSFPLSRLGDLLTPAELGWASEHLNLGNDQNRQKIPYLDEAASYDDPLCQLVLGKLKQSVESGAPVVGDHYLDVNGAVYADLCRCARLLGDTVRRAELLHSVSALEQFALPDGVAHTPGVTNRSGFVGDYLSYADAELQLYLCTGDPHSFERGETTLQRAIALFYDSDKQQMLTTLPKMARRMPRGFDNPDICDCSGESTTARAIRLLLDYGRMLEPAAGQKLIDIASALVGKGANLTSNSSPGMGAYYVASASLVDPECAFVTGPNATSISQRLFQLRPTRLVAPVSDSVRPDLLNRPPGIYIASGGSLAGPFSIAEAMKNMPLALQVGVGPSR